MNKSGVAAGRGEKQPVPDKVDMSLDDIIRMNRKAQPSKRKQLPGKRPQVVRKGRFAQGNAGYVAQRNLATVHKAGGVLRGGVSKLRSKRFLPQIARRRGQGVVTGLASRRPTSLQRGFITPNTTAYTQQAAQRTGQRAGQRFGQRLGQRTRPFVQRTEAQYQRPEPQWQTHRGGQTGPQRGQMSAPGRRPFQLRRRPLPPAHHAQRDARQATFLTHRGLKVHAQVQKQGPHIAPVRTRQWQNSTKSNGLLTVSIDNPSARTQPEPPTAWTLLPQPPASAPVKLEPAAEKKTPKGVPLQFDINSVAKPQTAMTLNERFRILKDQRTTTQSNKGSRFVTVS